MHTSEGTKITQIPTGTNNNKITKPTKRLTDEEFQKILDNIPTQNKVKNNNKIQPTKTFRHPTTGMD